MKTIPLFWCLLGGLSMLASSCFTPRQVIRMAPAATENVFWHQGQAIAEDKRDSIVSRAAYSHTTRDYFIFDLEFFNESSRPCFISPENFRLVTEGNFQIPAADPEQVLFAAEMEASRREARTKNWAVAGGVALATAAVVAATSSDGNEAADTGEAYDALDASVDVAQGMSMVAWGLDFHLNPVLSVAPEVLPEPHQPVFWQEVALRRTTLMPGASIRGLVAFPRRTEAQRLSLEVPTECTSFNFHFVQRIFQP